MTDAGAIALPVSVDLPLLLLGDCLDLLARLPAASVDLVLTDPPSSIDFMNLGWDEFSGYQPRTRAGRNILRKLSSVERMDAAIQALKSEVLAARVELKATAPKTVERRIASAVCKALKRALKKAKAALAIEAGDLAAFVGLAPEHSGFVAFMTDVWSEVDRVLKPGGFVCAWALPKTADLAGLALRVVGWELHDSLLHLFGGGKPSGLDVGKAIDKIHGAKREVVGVYARPDGNRRDYDAWADLNTPAHGDMESDRTATAPATDDARRWDGWHSQLAPGHEHWLLARKPTRLTYARQVLAHCTGALHVDACRIPRGDKAKFPEGIVSDTETAYGGGDGMYADRPRGGDTNPGGSWPRNVMISTGGSECPAAELDRQTAGAWNGQTRNVEKFASRETGGACTYRDGLRDGTTGKLYAGTGDGASRYFTRFDDRVFYGGKAHRRDIPGSSQRIEHPTHKSPELMDWLTRLLAATAETTGGEPAVVLDCFGGSGTGVVSAIKARVRCIYMDSDPVSHATASARVAAAVGNPGAAQAANVEAESGSQLSLM